jgi:hypothetical protein
MNEDFGYNALQARSHSDTSYKFVKMFSAVDFFLNFLQDSYYFIYDLCVCVTLF